MQCEESHPLLTATPTIQVTGPANQLGFFDSLSIIDSRRRARSADSTKYQKLTRTLASRRPRSRSPAAIPNKAARLEVQKHAQRDEAYNGVQAEIFELKARQQEIEHLNKELVRRDQELEITRKEKEAQQGEIRGLKSEVHFFFLDLSRF